MMKPSLLNPAWKYVDSQHTNVAATFKRIRKELKDKEAKERAAALERIAKVKPMTRSA